MGVELAKCDRQPGKQMEASIVRRQLHGVVEINKDRANVESMILESEKIKEKLVREKEKPDFKEQLRELDAKILGKANMGCNMQKVPKARILESEKKVT